MEIDVPTLVSGSAIASLGAGAYTLLKAWWDQRHRVRIEDRTDLGLVVAELRADNQRLRDERAAALAQATALEVRIAVLIAQSDELAVPMIAITPAGGEIVWCNSALVERWLLPAGLTADGVIGRRHAEVLSAEASSEIAAAVAVASANTIRAALVESVELPGIPDRWHLYVVADVRRRGAHLVGWVILAIPRGHSTGGTGHGAATI